MPIHRQIKNVVRNYSEAERKVREATCNDPWGPSSTLMAEIADKTHNVMAFTEIMQMIWKRLNDKSKNWRHVYKSLILLEYLIKTGSDKVATQCRENIHSIETLKDFEYFEDGKDCGRNVRMKARILSSLLRDEEQLHEERTRALLARDRFIHSSLGSTSSASNSPSRFGSVRGNYQYGIPSSNYADKSLSSLPPKSPVPGTPTDLHCDRPQSVHEERLQLQLALAISKEEHDREEVRRRAEEVKEEAKVQMVLEQSRREEQREKSLKQQQLASSSSTNGSVTTPSNTATSTGCLFTFNDSSNLATVQLSDPWSIPRDIPKSSAVHKGFGAIPIDDPWNTNQGGQLTAQSNPIASINSTGVVNVFEPIQPVSTVNESFPSDVLSTYNELPNTSDNNNLNSFNFPTPTNCTNGNSVFYPVSTSSNGTPSADSIDNQSPQETQPDGQPARKRTPADFLGEHQNLVDLEKLVVKNPASTNPFTVGVKSLAGPSSNPFLASQLSKPSLNQLNTNSTALPALTDHPHNQQKQLVSPSLYTADPYYPASQSNFPMIHSATNPWTVATRPHTVIFQEQQQRQMQSQQYQIGHAQQQLQPQTPLNPFY